MVVRPSRGPDLAAVGGAAIGIRPHSMLPGSCGAFGRALRGVGLSFAASLGQPRPNESDHDPRSALATDLSISAAWRKARPVISARSLPSSKPKRRAFQQSDATCIVRSTSASQPRRPGHTRAGGLKPQGELHRRIDTVRELLGLSAGPQRVSFRPRLDQIASHRPIGELERIGDRSEDHASPSEYNDTL
jgi:hypothetical protein